MAFCGFNLLEKSYQALPKKVGEVVFFSTLLEKTGDVEA
jgi:hypothetical protein